MSIGRLLSAALVVAVLAGCVWPAHVIDSTATPPPKPRLDQADSALTADCIWPLAARSLTLTQDQLETLLRTNARNQIACWRIHHAFVDFIRNRDGALTGSSVLTRSSVR